MVVGLFNLYKSKRQPIYKACDIWAKGIMRIRIFACKLGGTMPNIIIRIFKIYKTNAADRRNFIIKLSPKVIVFRRLNNIVYSKIRFLFC